MWDIPEKPRLGNGFDRTAKHICILGMARHLFLGTGIPIFPMKDILQMTASIIKTLSAGILGIFMCPVFIYASPEGNRSSSAQELDDILRKDVETYARRAADEKIISIAEKESILRFVQDSLPEDKRLRINVLKQLRDRIDMEYDEMIQRYLSRADEMDIYGKTMVERILPEPEDYTPENIKKLKKEQEAALRIRKYTAKFIKATAPVKMGPVMQTALRLIAGRGTSHSPELSDREVVPVHGGLYNIYMPGWKPSGIDPSLFDDTKHFDPSVYKRPVPKMDYDPHPDKHFRR